MKLYQAKIERTLMGGGIFRCNRGVGWSCFGTSLPKEPMTLREVTRTVIDLVENMSGWSQLRRRP